MTFKSLHWSWPCIGPSWTCPDFSRTLVMTSISADCQHPAPVSLHYPDRIMVLVLTCAELMFCTALWFVCSAQDLHLMALQSSLSRPALSFSCSAMHFLAFSISTCHVPSCWHRKRQCISGKSFLLASRLSFKSLLFDSEAKHPPNSSKEGYFNFIFSCH